MFAGRVVMQLRGDRLLLQQQDAVAHQLALAELDPQLAALVGQRYIDRAGRKCRLLNLLDVRVVVHQNLRGLRLTVHCKKFM